MRKKYRDFIIDVRTYDIIHVGGVFGLMPWYLARAAWRLEVWLVGGCFAVVLLNHYYDYGYDYNYDHDERLHSIFLISVVETETATADLVFFHGCYVEKKRVFV